ncbi:MAG: 30S ribosomal protein S3 [Parcubacteria group bacterium]|nr:30S ribosomal protein S3 [Parcubacteria group bacterium]MBI2175582.1 30S ribosomal protein S3 [Parcubacteria group bacterium]
MSHAVHPYAFRIGIHHGWKSRWFATKRYQEFLKTDVLLRAWLHKQLRSFYVERIDIERAPMLLHIIVRTSRPGLIIGRGGEGVGRLKQQIAQELVRLRSGIPKELKLTVEEVRAPESRAAIVAQMVADDLERRLPFRRVMKQSAEKVMANREVQGFKVMLSGRLGGAEMGRREWLKRGRIPLQTLRSDVDFARSRAHLPYGDLGVKVWIYRGEIFSDTQAKN